VIDEAADQRVGDQTGCWHALVNDLRRDRLLHQSPVTLLLAALASPFAPDVTVHEELGWHDVLNRPGF
jgi:hypothetical protein